MHKNGMRVNVIYLDEKFARILAKQDVGLLLKRDAQHLVYLANQFNKFT